MEPPRRHSIRLPGYDHAHPGAYFVTICTKGGEDVFGEVVGGEVLLNQVDCNAQEEWARSALIRHQIVLDEFVTMPNHVHGIVLIKHDTVGTTGRRCRVVFPARSPLRSGEVGRPGLAHRPGVLTAPAVRRRCPGGTRGHVSGGLPGPVAPTVG